jgi:hypothetical protein
MEPPLKLTSSVLSNRFSYTLVVRPVGRFYLKEAVVWTASFFCFQICKTYLKIYYVCVYKQLNLYLMKKTYLLTASLAFLASAFVADAQIKSVKGDVKGLMSMDQPSESTITHMDSKQAKLFKASRNAIWEEDFSGGFNSSNGTWTVSGPDQLWEYTTAIQAGCYTGGANAVADFTTKSNGFMLYHSDLANCVDPNTNPPTISTNSLTGSLTSPSIDLSAVDAVAVTFEQLFRFCCSANITLNLSVSNDGGTTWTHHNVGAGVSANNYGDMTTSVDISATAANQSDVILQFTWNAGGGNSHYFWALDDIYISEIPDNDLIMTSDYGMYHSSYENPFSFVEDDSIRYYYRLIPESQVAPMSFYGTVQNFGYNTQNAILQVDKSGNVISSNPMNLVQGQVERLYIHGHSYVGEADDVFTIGYSTTSTDPNFVDETPSNNVAPNTTIFGISNTVMAVDAGELTGNYGGASVVNFGSSNPGDEFGLAAIYEIRNNVQVESITVGIGASTNIQFGVLMSITMGNFNTGEVLGEIDVTIQPSQLNNNAVTLLTFDFPQPIQLQAGQTYEVWFEHFGDADELFIATSGMARTGSIFLKIGEDLFVYSNPQGPVIRMNFVNPLCADLAVSANQVGNEWVATATGGTAPYAYNWTDSQGNSIGTGASVGNLGTIATGVYTVTVTDANGCTSSHDINWTSANEITVKSKINVFPNPANNVINFEMDNVNARSIQIYDMTGKLVTNVDVRNSFVSVDLSSLSEGLYIYKINDINGATIKTDKFSIMK